MSAVYGEAPSLPFHLHKLELFYLDSPHWQGRHPTPKVGLPLSTCSTWSKPSEQCSRGICEQWLLPGDMLSQEDPIADLDTPIYPRLSKYASTENFFFLQDKSFTPARMATPNHSWIEVMRVETTRFQTNEGTMRHGIWFTIASGSGIWVNTGVTLLNITGLAQHDMQWPGAVYMLGYDSVQLSEKRVLVTTGNSSMVCQTSSCNTRRGIRICPPFEIRTGLNHQVACACAEGNRYHGSKPFLNCG